MIDSMTKRYDLIVIGGGSAGMAAAIFTAHAGKKVLVFDASGPAFDKPCGEGFMPPAVFALEELGVELPPSRKLVGVKFVTETGQSASAFFSRDTLALGIRRRYLREAMWKRAKDLGVEIRHEVVDAVHHDQQKVTVNGVEGDYLCVASGANGKILHKLGLAKGDKRSTPVHRVGMRRHINMQPWSDFVEVYWRDHCELYITPVADHCVNIAVLSWKPLSFEAALKKFPEVEAKINSASWDDEPAGKAPLYHRSRRVRSGRVLIAGDAAMFLDAMTGEGNTLAIRSGMAAARAVINGKPYFYPFYWISVVWRYWLLTRPVLIASRHVSLKKYVLHLITVAPGLMQTAINFLTGPKHHGKSLKFQVQTTKPST